MAAEQQYVFPDRVRFLSSQPKESDVALAPYARVNGQWTLPDEVALAVARQSMRDGTFRTVFIEGDVQTPEEFLMMVQNPRNAVVFAFRGLDPIGVGWLNSINGTRAFCHFLFLSG